jgi:hypothetical protein
VRPDARSRPPRSRQLACGSAHVRVSIRGFGSDGSGGEASDGRVSGDTLPGDPFRARRALDGVGSYSSGRGASSEAESTSARTRDATPLLSRLGYAITDAWWNLGDALERVIAVLGSTRRREHVLSDQYNRKLARLRNRRTALGAALTVILSRPADEADVVARYRLETARRSLGQAQHLPVLLWYRDVIVRRPIQSKRRRQLLTLMVALVGADRWPEPRVGAPEADPTAWAQDWQEHVAAQRRHPAAD